MKDKDFISFLRENEKIKEFMKNDKKLFKNDNT